MKIVLWGMLVILTGCAVTPPSIIERPHSQAVAATSPQNMATPGAIYQSGGYQPLFEDVRARRLGDSLTITLQEQTNSTTTSGKATSKTASTSASVPSFFGASAAKTSKFGVSSKMANNLSEKGSGTVGNTFTGTIAVVVTEVLPNGNLRVSGEKQLGFDRQTEYVRFSGIVSPSTIMAGNVVPSTQVADAKIEYRTNSHIDRSEMMSILDRFFLSVIPF